MTKSFVYPFAYAFLAILCSARAGGSFNSNLHGGLTAVASAEGNPQARTDAAIVNSQNVSAISSDPFGSSNLQAYNALVTTGGIINYTFNASAQMSGGSGALPQEICDVVYSFTTTVPMYYNLGAYFQVTQYMAVQIVLEDTAGGYVYEQLGINSGVSDADPSGQYPAVPTLLQPGSYAITLRLESELPEALTSPDSFAGNYYGWLILTPAPLPSVATGDATSFSSSTATLTGTVNPNGQATQAWFQYWTATTYGGYASVLLAPNNSTSSQPVSYTISGLSHEIYYYRLVARNGSGTVFGQVMQVAPQNDDNTVQFTSANFNVNRKFPYAVVTVSIVQNDPSSGCTVTYSTQDGTAVAGTNYTKTQGMLTWQPGDTKPKNIIIPISASVNTTGNNAFSVVLSTPITPTLGTPSQTTVTIDDSNGPATPQPAIASITPTSGSVHLECIGMPNTSCQIESSRDLSANSFVPQATITADAGGSFYYDDATTATQKFYRIVYPTTGADTTNAAHGAKTARPK